ncbi:histidine kinase [uncultured Alistipes sp.]|uniref:sensor histidine kinase n=1 Tax=uncultured Alistipes sp. TaxID=538949 RepID=UPI00263A224D|nr:histidine kinase [uncultured Alistipes sp.]
MKRSTNKNKIIVNLFVAGAIVLVVNFMYILPMLVGQDETRPVISSRTVQKLKDAGHGKRNRGKTVKRQTSPEGADTPADPAAAAGADSVDAGRDFGVERGAWTDTEEEEHDPAPRVISGKVSRSPYGHGFLIYESSEPVPSGNAAADDSLRYGQRIDSIYLSDQVMVHMRLKDGDSVDVELFSLRANNSPIGRTISVNGKRYRPHYAPAMVKHWYNSLTLQFVGYFVLAFLLLSIMTRDTENYSMKLFLKRSLLCLALTLLFYFLEPVLLRGVPYQTLPWYMRGRWIDYTLVLKCLFTLVVCLFYAQIVRLLHQRQAMILENEQLKNENMTTRYNMLVSQINPHFFFNSLNSLAMLVREKEESKALAYIDRLSYSFRYIIQNGQNMLTTLAEELRFAESYCYLFKIRYADKLFFDIEVDAAYLSCRLPVLTLQELLANAVKHNAITKRSPLHVSIRVDDGVLVVSNPRSPKLDAVSGTGTGLRNLDSRWQLITGQGIRIVQDDKTFSVRLPLLEPQQNKRESQ